MRRVMGVCHMSVTIPPDHPPRPPFQITSSLHINSMRESLFQGPDLIANDLGNPQGPMPKFVGHNKPVCNGANSVTFASSTQANELRTFLNNEPTARELLLVMEMMRSINRTKNIRKVFHDNADLVLDFLNLRDVLSFGNSSRSNKFYVRNYLKRRRYGMLGGLLNDTSAFLQVMRLTGAVISGSWALAFIMGLGDGENWLPKDLDLYVAGGQACKILLGHLMECHDYDLLGGYYTDDIQGIAVPLQPPLLYTFSQGAIKCVFRLERQRFNESTGEVVVQYIDVIQSKTDQALDPILGFDQTCVMNWISATGIFCAYPSLTFRNKAIDQAHSNDPKARERRIKYMKRGFRLQLDTADFGDGIPCKEGCLSIRRNTMDTGTLRFYFDGRSPYSYITPVEWNLTIGRTQKQCRNLLCPRRREALERLQQFVYA